MMVIELTIYEKEKVTQRMEKLKMITLCKELT